MVKPRIASASRLLVAGALFWSGWAGATVVLAVSRARMVRESDLVVRAKVGEQRTTWSENHRALVTLTRLEVLEAYKGALEPGDALTLRQLGGALDGRAMAVAGDGHVQPSEEVVLFLRQRGDRVYLFALAQSAYRVVRAPGKPAVALRDLRGLSFATLRGGTPITPAPPEVPETLSQLESSIRSSLSGGRAP